MGKARIKTRTSYFIVTPGGKLRKVNLSLVIMIALILVGTMGFFVKESYTLNQRLMAEEQKYLTELASLNNNKMLLEQNLQICEQKKEEIGSLLYFNTDSGKTADAK